MHIINTAKDDEIEQLVTRLLPIVDVSGTDQTSIPMAEEMNAFFTVILADHQRFAGTYVKAEGGNAQAQPELDQIILQNWRGRPKMNRLALYFLRLAARQGEVKAQRTIWNTTPALEQESGPAQQQTSGRFLSEQDVEALSKGESRRFQCTDRFWMLLIEEGCVLFLLGLKR